MCVAKKIFNLNEVNTTSCTVQFTAFLEEDGEKNVDSRISKFPVQDFALHFCFIRDKIWSGKPARV